MNKIIYFIVIIIINCSCSTPHCIDKNSILSIGKSTITLKEYIFENKIPINVTNNSFNIRNICDEKGNDKLEIENLEDGIYTASNMGPHNIPVIFAVRDDSLYILNKYEEESIDEFLEYFVTGSDEEVRLICYIKTLYEIKSRILDTYILNDSSIITDDDLELDMN